MQGCQLMHIIYIYYRFKAGIMEHALNIMGKYHSEQKQNLIEMCCYSFLKNPEMQFVNHPQMLPLLPLCGTHRFPIFNQSLFRFSMT